MKLGLNDCLQSFYYRSSSGFSRGRAGKQVDFGLGRASVNSTTERFRDLSYMHVEVFAFCSEVKVQLLAKLLIQSFSWLKIGKYRF